VTRERHDASARASRPLTQPWSPPGVKGPFLQLAPAFFIVREVPLLAETDFEEDQEQASGESRRHQDDREDFARHSLDQGGTRTACDHQHGGRSKRNDAQPRGHAFNGIGNPAMGIGHKPILVPNLRLVPKSAPNPAVSSSVAKVKKSLLRHTNE
jgi:hypothetical protein